MSHVMNTYARQPVAFVRGEGIWLWDAEGKRYLDALSGIAVNTLGHAHPRLLKAINEQAGRLMHVSNLFENPWQEKLANKLTEISGMDYVFFCNSGCEANEAAIKLARLHAHQKGIDSPAIIVMEHSFHGRTLATLSATGSRKVQAGFEPLVSGFVRVPYGDAEAVAQVADHNKNVAAILVEPIQGEGGINVPVDCNYMHRLREICTANSWLLMLDEVQTGTGRTGRWFEHQHCGIIPDVMTLAKGLGSGVPIGACVTRGPGNLFKPGNHGSTFGGNALACTAALATIEIIEDEKLLANATEVGNFLMDGLRSRLSGVEGVVEVRGVGLMIGLELARPCGELVQRALKNGLVMNVTADKVVRLLPPLTINKAEASQLLDLLCPLVQEFLAGR